MWIIFFPLNSTSDCDKNKIHDATELTFKCLLMSESHDESQ